MVPMRQMRKTIGVSLLSALVYLISGTCVFPVASAQAAMTDMPAMTDMSGMAFGDHGESIDCADQHGSCDSGQNDFGACALTCGNSAVKTAVIKKIQDTTGLSPLGPVQESFLVPVDTRPVGEVSVDSSGRDPVLLAVAQKE